MYLKRSINIETNQGKEEDIKRGGFIKVMSCCNLTIDNNDAMVLRISIYFKGVFDSANRVRLKPIRFTRSKRAGRVLVWYTVD